MNAQQQLQGRCKDHDGKIGVGHVCDVSLTARQLADDKACNIAEGCDQQHGQEECQAMRLSKN